MSPDQPVPLSDVKPADAIASVLVDRVLPPPARPYARLMRLDRPIGWWLLLLPGIWSSALASASLGQAPNIGHFILMFLGAVLMRGAGSTWNDIVDRNLDGSVERTRNRPIPSGAVSARQAAAFMAAQMLVSLGILLQFNRTTIGVALASLILVLAYPFAKRVSNHPQLVLGLVFSWAALVGWTAITDALTAPALLLYGAAVFWIIGYDTIYALQDIEDDPVVGIGSTALAYGDRVPMFVAAMYGLAVAFAILAWAMATPRGWFGLAGVAAYSVHLLVQVLRIRLDDPKFALQQFKSNREAGLALAAGFIAEALYRAL